MSAFLVPIDPGLCLIPLEKAIVLIGRQADCDVSLTHSRKISRKHCCVAQVNNTFVVRDLGSTNGIFVNGVRIARESVLKLGDELAIGDVHFRLQADTQPPSTSKRPAEKKEKKKLPPLPEAPLTGNRSEAPPSLDVPIAIPEFDRDFRPDPIPQLNRVFQRNPSSDTYHPLVGVGSDPEMHLRDSDVV